MSSVSPDDTAGQATSSEGLPTYVKLLLAAVLLVVIVVAILDLVVIAGGF